MQRYLYSAVTKDLDSKIVLVTGPRQCGKTTLAKMLPGDFQYLNYDLAEHRLLLQDKTWDRNKAFIIFDELHKMANWKTWLKGVYDVEGIPPALIVTGSASLEAFKKAGDSLAGRHFQFRLHPIDFKEATLHSELNHTEILKRLLTVGGFPEPFINGSPTFYKRWRKTHVDLILKQDMLSLSAVRDIQAIETLIEMLRSRVGSPVSASSIAQDLQKSPNTIKQWLELLENLYVIFKVTPYHKNIARSLLKEPKYYFFDNASVIGDNGQKLENLVACSLLKEVHRVEDTEGDDLRLHYIRNKDGHELDFLVTKNSSPLQLVEVKWNDTNLSPNFKKFKVNTALPAVQIVHTIPDNKSYPSGERIESAAHFLSRLDYSQGD